MEMGSICYKKMWCVSWVKEAARVTEESIKSVLVLQVEKPCFSVRVKIWSKLKNKNPSF